MHIEREKWLIAYVVATMLFASHLSCYKARANPQVPCVYIFGDSLVDSGNNNGKVSLARADFMPYGIDFPRGPTGRFSNGKTVIDAITDLLGFDDYIQPFANISRRDILRGVNYASAAGGIREETGQQLGFRISFRGQINNYVSTVSQVVRILGSVDAASNHLKQCIFMVVMGSNDYLNNYFMPDYYDTNRKYTTKEYADALIQQYAKQIRVLYDYGARKFALNGIGQVGCSPNKLALQSQDGRTCVAKINSAVQEFNRRLISLVDDFNKNFPDAKFTYINNYDIFQDLLDRPQKYGFKVTNRGCCGSGRNNAQYTCLPYQIPCQNRNQYLFWDNFHPTEAASIIVASRSYNARSSSDAYPIDIRRLAQL